MEFSFLQRNLCLNFTENNWLTYQNRVVSCVVCVHVVLCVVLMVVCCFVVVVRACGVWWSLAHSISLLLSLLLLLFLFRFSFLLLFCLYFSLALSLILVLVLVLSLFSSRHQTLLKEPINQHGVKHRGIRMWFGVGQVHSSRFSPSSSPFVSLFSPFPPEKEGFFILIPKHWACNASKL